MKQRPYYGWVIVVLAAISMVATLPGRTVGLGLITEALIADLDLQRTQYAQINMIATLLGSLFALIAGPSIDRWGMRITLSATLLFLGGLVMMMSQWVTAASIMIFLILIRGVGQSALSTISVTSVGKWFTHRLAIAMGVFSIIVAIGFSAAIVGTQTQIEPLGWRKVWMTIGLSILALGVLSILLARRSPVIDAQTAAVDSSALPVSLSLINALRTPCFWVFGISMALYAGVFAGVSLFNESILQELGFGAETFRLAMAGLMSAGLLGNLMAALAARHFSLPRVMAVSLAILAAVLLSYSHLKASWQVITHAGAFGFCGGVFSVLFFTGFGKAFGRLHLGKIQGCAQVMVVMASALGPWWLAGMQERHGTYFPAMANFAPVFAIIAILSWFTTLPSSQTAERKEWCHSSD